MDRRTRNRWLISLWLICAVLGILFILTLPVSKPDLPPAEGNASAAEDSSGELRPGDVNRDGILDAADVLALQNIYLLGESDLTWEEQLTLADLNGDGVIDTSDTAILTAYLSDSSIDTSSVSLTEYAQRYSG